MAAAHTILLDAGEHGTLKLVFKFGTLRKAETELGRTLTKSMAGGDMGFDEVSAVFWAALQPSLMISRDGSDNLIDIVGPVAATKAVMEGIAAVFGSMEPDASAAETKGEKAGNKAAAKKGD